MTLTEFLLARIEQDDQRATDNWFDRPHDEWGYDTRHEYFAGWDAEKLMRDCEAKKRIVTRLGPIFEERQLAYDLAEYVLLDLASVYSDHADYNSEWTIEDASA